MPTTTAAMSSAERRSVLTLSLIYALRMLGIFLLLPVLALYAFTLPGANALLVGLCFGIYGLTQALLQIPFGFLSDKFGRKPLITIGLALFAIGSAVAGTADSIYGLLLGRALQGSGAVAGVVIALIADLTRDEQRTKAMAIIGMAIGLSFALSIVVAPILADHLGTPGLFWLITVFSVTAIIALYVLVPDAPVIHNDPLTTMPISSVFKVLANRQLQAMNLSIFCLHALLSMFFLTMPVLLADVGLATGEHWHLYLPLMAAAFVLMLPLLFLAEKYQQHKLGFIIAITLLGCAQLGFWYEHKQTTWIFASSLLFFIGFNFLEASLPSLLSKMAPKAAKGTALGIYSTSQFLGIFVGGALGGWIMHQGGSSALFLSGLILCSIWVLLAMRFSFVATLSSAPVAGQMVSDAD